MLTRTRAVSQVSSSSLLLSSLELNATKVYEPEIRARLGTAAQVWKEFEAEYGDASQYIPDVTEWLSSNWQVRIQFKNNYFTEM